MYYFRIVKYLCIGTITLGISLSISVRNWAQETPLQQVGDPFDTGELVIGVRTIASDVATYNEDTGRTGGFCSRFGQILGKKLELSVRYEEIDNVYNSGIYQRYDGLRKNYIHAECGPNSRPQVDGEHTIDIHFSSAYFHETGIKILISEEIYDQLESGDKTLSDINISVLAGTTTEKTLEDLAAQGKIGLESRPSSRLNLINSLLDDSVQAYASDTLILKALVSKDFELVECPNAEEKCDSKVFTPLGVQGFKIYPLNGYISGRETTDQYVIAMWDKLPSQQINKLKEAIEEALEDEELAPAIEALANAEKLGSGDFPLSITLIISIALILSFISLSFYLIYIRKIRKKEGVTAISEVPLISEEGRESVRELEALMEEILGEAESEPTANQKALALSAGIEQARDNPKVRRLWKAIKVTYSAYLERSDHPPHIAAFLEGVKVFFAEEENDESGH